MNNWKGSVDDVRKAVQKCPYYMNAYKRMKISYERLDIAKKRLYIETIDNILSTWDFMLKSENNDSLNSKQSSQ